MIKTDIVARVSSAAGLTKVQSEAAVEAMLAALRGFGVFMVRPRKRGVGRNPRTGYEVRIPPGRTVRFKPGKDLHDISV